MLEVMRVAVELGIRCIDVRHEQAAAMMAQGWSRLNHRPGVCITASGPGTTNAASGVVNALIDCTPMVAIGGSVETTTFGRGEFQDIDQVKVMEAVTKAAFRIYSTERIPEQIQTAFLLAMSGQPGPVYVDLPADVLFREVDDAAIGWPQFDLSIRRPPADAEGIRAAIALLKKARRPIALSGTGALASDATQALDEFLDTTNMPLFTTPQGRGILPETDARLPVAARSRAFSEADLLVVVGTRMNFVFNFGRPPRFAPGIPIIQVDIDPVELARNPLVSVRLQGDAAAVLNQLTDAWISDSRPSQLDGVWVNGLRDEHRAKSNTTRKWQLSLRQEPIDPRRLCAEIAELLPEDAVLVVDGHVILNHARQSIPTSHPSHRLNSGPFGCLGVGVPFGIAAKVARPDRLVLVLTGDGSFGFNAFEIDTALRHDLRVVIVVSNNGGWAADHGDGQPGQYLGHTRYDLMFAPLGVHTEFVVHPEEIRPALSRAIDSGKLALVNVVTDPKMDAHTVPFSTYYDGGGKLIPR